MFGNLTILITSNRGRMKWKLNTNVREFQTQNWDQFCFINASFKFSQMGLEVFGGTADAGSAVESIQNEENTVQMTSTTPQLQQIQMPQHQQWQQLFNQQEAKRFEWPQLNNPTSKQAASTMLRHPSWTVAMIHSNSHQIWQPGEVVFRSICEQRTAHFKSKRIPVRLLIRFLFFAIFKWHYLKF